jgi:transmembrane sensor
MSGKNHKKELIRRYRDNKASSEELEVFFHLMSQGELNEELEEVMNEETLTEVHSQRVLPLYKRSWFRVAAAVLLFAASAVTYIVYSKTKEPQVIAESKPVVQDIAPGGDKAILQLADGSTIVLENAANDSIVKQGNANVLKKDGLLAYNAVHGNSTEILFNTVTTPIGGQYQLILADGSKVWLNAASSIRFPTVFAGKQRKVEVTGEAYFEVAKNASMPFIVVVDGKSEVEVLGTHFNINSYADEATINTTLLEGSVNVKGNGESKIITPGQQAQVNAIGQITLNKQPDIEQVMAWKNGLFNFKGESIETVMRQLARWYDFSVQYQEPVTEKFYVKLNRNTNISNIFKILETTGGVHFKIEGKKITVKP